jgi:outer membrane protein assembly factor BamA
MIAFSRAVAGAGILPVLGFLLVLALPGRSEGQSTPYGGWPVRELAVEGIPDEAGAPFPKGLALGVKSGLLRQGRPPFRPDDLEKDESRIRLWLARHGYPYASTESEVTPRAGEEAVDVTITVSPGPAVIISSVEVEGTPPDFGNAEKLLRRSVRTDGPFVEQVVRAAGNELEKELARAGHARAKVRLRVTRPDSTRAEITYTAEPGPVFTIDEVVVTGEPEALLSLAERTIGVRPGTKYSPQILERSRDSLRRLALFRQVRVYVEESGETGLVLRAEVTPGKHRTLSLSVGSWSDDPWRVSALWRHRNLFGGGRGFEARGTVSRYLREAGGLTWWPALLTARSRLELDGSWRLEDEDAYQEEELRAELANTFRPSFETTWRVGVAWSDVKLDVLSPDADVSEIEPGRLWSVLGQWRRDGSDDLLSPSRGWRWSFSGEYSPEGGFSDSPFASGDVQVSKYLAVAPGTVLASRVALGLAEPLGDNPSLLPSRRFYAGGVNTMRGYGRRKLGPRDSAGNPIGGEARVLLNGELRFPLVRWFRGATFIDAGQVWEKLDDVNGDLQVAGGLGLVLATPVGPVRLDFAWLLTEPIADDQRWQIHFAIGNPF